MNQPDPWRTLAGKLRALADEIERGPSPYPIRCGTTDDQTWTITLNRYHRDNLIKLFNAIGYPWGNRFAEDDMRSWNTGDWVGEIPMMLARTDGSMVIDAKDNPNPRVAWPTEKVKNPSSERQESNG